MLLNILKYTEEHLTTNNYLVLHFNSAKVENTWPVKSSVLWSLPINPAECLFISSLTHSLTLSHAVSFLVPYWQTFPYLKSLGHYCCPKQFLLSHFRQRVVYTNGPGLRYVTQLRKPGRIQGMATYAKELEILPKDNGASKQESSMKQFLF